MPQPHPGDYEALVPSKLNFLAHKCDQYRYQLRFQI